MPVTCTCKDNRIGCIGIQPVGILLGRHINLRKAKLQYRKLWTLRNHQVYVCTLNLVNFNNNFIGDKINMFERET